ncbi:unnamed protein product [Arctia plantaginis]|uniref:Uncharacterized protein n=1 Tax=Arctia plantaginis TaxID=874455 RepID=A0A8S1B0F5_ARCPL|nr:unnamed protein product [Arctia plantaginis]
MEKVQIKKTEADAALEDGSKTKNSLLYMCSQMNISYPSYQNCCYYYCYPYISYGPYVCYKPARPCGPCGYGAYGPSGPFGPCRACGFPCGWDCHRHCPPLNSTLFCSIPYWTDARLYGTNLPGVQCSLCGNIGCPPIFKPVLVPYNCTFNTPTFSTGSESYMVPFQGFHCNSHLPLTFINPIQPHSGSNTLLKKQTDKPKRQYIICRAKSEKANSNKSAKPSREPPERLNILLLPRVIGEAPAGKKKKPEKTPRETPERLSMLLLPRVIGMDDPKKKSDKPQAVTRESPERLNILLLPRVIGEDAPKKKSDKAQTVTRESPERLNIMLLPRVMGEDAPKKKAKPTEVARESPERLNTLLLPRVIGEAAKPKKK